ncbi:hypothetical protein X797_011841 [Metarhizium robertsii]|uniref:Uncharacterized protein n=2 Tax=Metarhizium robertsii TaxID=568076 RepID=E9FCM7_METRA|nr:uncharacterized protein MAA_10026 [Metarhizium robertsii ARSEF 23]EFY94534.1 hypothetical protein MAA_10026 [Metarhizium robertsii ARSEF 23]EXU95082.1 hypothetical protein X797_011841 [Metarhizium robertsii]
MLSDQENDPFLKAEADTVASKEDFQSLHDASIHNWHTCRSYATSLKTYWLPIFVFSTTSLVWGFILLYFLRQAPHFTHITSHFAEDNQIYGMPISGYNFLRCGTSVADAKAFGCEYDILANHWVPKLCIDQKAVEDYQSDGTWHGFADENRTEPISLEAMGELEYYYTSERDHIVHCAMLWRKQYNAFAQGRKYLDSITADPEHTNHCIHYLMDMTDLGQDFRTVSLQVNVGFAGCYVGED